MLIPFPCNPTALFHPTSNLWPCSGSVCGEKGGERQNGMVSGADGAQGAMLAWTRGCRIRDRLLAVAVQPQTHPAGDKGIFPPFFAMRLGEMQPLIARRLKWRTRLPAEVTNSDRSDAVAMTTLVSWETPKGCHGIPSPIPLGPRSSRKKPFQMVPAPSSRRTPRLCPATRPHPGTPFPGHIPATASPVPNKAPVGNKYTTNPPLPRRGAHTLAVKFGDGVSSCKHERPLHRERPRAPPAPCKTQRFPQTRCEMALSSQQESSAEKPRQLFETRGTEL